MVLQVTKRDGSLEPLNIDKLHKVVIWATYGLAGVSASEVEIKSRIQFRACITTTDIHETMIKSAAELISEATPNYQYVAGRLINYHLRKEVYNGHEPCHIKELVDRNAALGFYDSELPGLYTNLEWDVINEFLEHERDMALTYAAMEQFRGKYLVKNRVSGALMETPQVAYALIAATIFSQYPRDTRMRYVRDYYHAISRHEVSLPTPVMANVRTPQRQFSSCTLIEVSDDLESITETSKAIVKYVSQKAGIGLGAGSIRAVNSPVRNGDTKHSGLTPFFKLFQSSVGSCSQGSVRKGSACTYFPIFHMEIKTLLVLKNNKGTEETRIRTMDFGVQFSKLFYERLITGGDITLFSPHDVPDVYAAFFSNQDLFKKLYEAAERNPSIRKERMSALELFTSFMTERKETGRIYLQNVDNSNTHSSFDESRAPVRMSNLCTEVTIPTRPMGHRVKEVSSVQVADLPRFVERGLERGARVEAVTPGQDGTFDVTMSENNGRIALCILSAINFGTIRKPSDFERPCRLAVRALDALIDYQRYPMVEAYMSTMEYRPLGVGIINLAYWLAKNDLRYTDGSALPMLDEYMEAWSYYLIRASVDLAREKGPCLLNADSKYSSGIMPCDTRKKEVDKLVAHVERMPWDELRRDARLYGIRNATLMALMPSETSSVISNSTNGIEPLRAYVTAKGPLPQVAPELKKLRNKYELAWDHKSPVGYLQVCAILQKYVDQAISVNTYYNPENYEDGNVPMSELLAHLLMFYKQGGKSLYYCQTTDGAGEVDADKMIFGDGSSSVAQEECDSCAI